MTEVIERIKAKEIERGKEKRNVPKLRFREFKDEWETKSIKDFSERIIRKNKDNISKRVLTISAQYGLINQEEFFNKSVASKNLEGYYLLENGEFAYNKSYSNGYPFGAIKKLNKYKNGVVSNLYVCFKADNKLVNSNFLEQYFETDKWHKEISMIAVEGARNHGLLNISISDFFETKHNIPLIQEQKKIAHFFALIYKKIEKQSEKVEALKTYQKGIMQKIFKQEIRFKDENGREYPEWEEKRLWEFLIPRVEKQIPTKEAPLMAFTSTGGIESKGERYDRSFLVKNHKKLYKRTELNDFIYSSNNLDVGSIGLNKYGTAVISDVYEIFIINNQASLVFISTMIKMPKMLYKIIQYRQGVMYGQYRIHTDNFLKVKDFMPCLEEQIKIANLFNAIDKKIEKEEEKLEDLKVWKKGLLQKMFI